MTESLHEHEPNWISDSDERRDPVIPVATFEGEFVRRFEGKLPALSLELAEGYLRGTHLRLEVEARVRNVSYNEVSARAASGPEERGDLVRHHQFALEEVKLIEAFDPATGPHANVGGSAASTRVWIEDLVAFLEGDIDEIDLDGEELPDRLREMLKLYFDRVSADVPTITSEEFFSRVGVEMPTESSESNEADDTGDDEGVGF